MTVIRNGEQMDIRSQDIILGDLVKAARDCDVPCDLVLLKTSDQDGKCHITTANLDGETNLKTLSVPRGLPELGVGKCVSVWYMKAWIHNCVFMSTFSISFWLANIKIISVIFY